jgi:hypothetical protein
MRFRANLLAVITALPLPQGLWLAGLLATGAVSAQAPALNSEPPPLARAAGAAEPAARAEPGAQDDGWWDVSSFLDKKFGFLPMVRPITEPAIGYGAAGGLMFLSKSFGDVKAGLGRPNVTFVGGMGTSSKTWGVFAGDVRYWLEDHVQTLVAAMYASVNLDFYGVGKSDVLANDPLHYNLEPKGGLMQVKYRFGQSSFWAGINGRFTSTAVDFEARASSLGLAADSRTTNLGGATVLGAYDTRDNVFTTIRGTYAELSGGAFGAGDGALGRVDLVGLQFIPFPHRIYLGLRGQAAATFGPAPLYFRPYIAMRGVEQMRYQGDEIAQLELELRWQFWGRWSVLGFTGGGGAWNQLEKFDSAQGVIAGGGGFRYELARSYGIHAGIDVAGSHETAAVYIQVGSAWMRP